ncbi:MAG: peptide ABC transporter substrate-binding protein [Candidatus Merdivicinus sp.]|jgi:oligopeptide transport system substrate-binding protein
MIFPRKIFGFLIIGMMILLFSSCQFGRAENDFVYDLDASAVNLDPQSAGDTASCLVIANLFEGLVSVDDSGEPSPAAAKSWTVSSDERCYTFELLPEAKWENGDPVTAADFVFAFQRLLDPDTNAPFAKDFYGIENAAAVHSGQMEPELLGVHALSEYTLEIRLSEPDPSFFEKLSTAAAMPCHKEFFLETKGRYGLARENIMGNGPFYLSNWAENGNLSFRPNKYYHDAANVTATSLLYVVPKEERASKVERFLNGTLSAAHFSGSEYLSIRQAGDFEMQQNDSAVWGMVFNCNTEPFSSTLMRKALFLAADFSTMNAALPDYLEPISFIIPSSMEIDGKSYRSIVGNPTVTQHDVAAAQTVYQQALTEVDTDSIRGIRMILPAEEDHAEYFAYLAQIWQRDLGIYITVESLEQAEYEQRLSSGDFDCALLRLSGTSNPTALLSALDNSVYGCIDPSYSDLIRQAQQSKGTQMAQLCFQAEQLLLDTYSFLPFYRQSEYFVLNEGIHGITYHFQTEIPDFRYGFVK